jgi:hypothetical protein
LTLQIVVRLPDATQDVVWLQRFPGYCVLREGAGDDAGERRVPLPGQARTGQGYFDGATIEAGIWRQL